MIISVASGKGGTGKTTVATNMAISMDGQCTLLDCDVEEPNVHLFLHPVIERSETVTTFIPEVDESLCTWCRKCAEICRFRAIAVVGKKVLVFPELCHSCGGCQVICPDQAIAEGSRKLGVIEWGAGAGVPVVQGRLRVGEARAPPLSRKVRAAADSHGTVIIDAPPGTSCPVIAAMRGVDFVLLVTEPTPFGLHDLELAVGAVRLLDIPCGLVINRADMRDDRVRQYARREDLPVLLEIPFDRRIAETYSRGRMIVEEMPEWKEKFKGLFRQIEGLVEATPRGRTAP